MKKKIITMILAAVAAVQAGAAGIFDNIDCQLRVGYNIGGTAPLDMPATIRSMDAYKFTPSFSIGLRVHHPLGSRWGIASGLYLENKGMNVESTVKNYRMAIVRGGQRLEGNFTGGVSIEVDQWMLTLPLQAVYSFSDKVSVELGPYVSCVGSRKFTGYAYDGYLRVGDPTGAKVVMGSDAGNRGSYDFSDDMRNWQFGVNVGAGWNFYRQWGAFVSLSWGLTEVFRKGFDTIDQDLYPIFGSVGISYKL